MASITSVVALFVLLLATFSYSAPVGQEYGTSTPQSEFTTNQNMFGQGKPVNIRSMMNDESTRVSVPQGDRSSEEKQVTAVGVPLQFTTVGVPHSPRSYEDSSYAPMNDQMDERSYEENSSPSSPQMNNNRIGQFPTPSPKRESIDERSVTYSPKSESSEEQKVTNSPKREISEQQGEQNSSPLSPKNKQKPANKGSKYPSSSESNEQPKDGKNSSPPSTEMKPRRIPETSTYPSTSGSSEQPQGGKNPSSSSGEMKPRRIPEDSTYPSTSGSSEQPKGGKNPSSSSGEMKPRRIPETSTYPSTSGSSEQSQGGKNSSPSSGEMKPRRIPEDSTYPSSSGSSEQPKGGKNPSTSYGEMKRRCTHEDSNNPSTSESSEQPKGGQNSLPSYGEKNPLPSYGGKNPLPSYGEMKPRRTPEDSTYPSTSGSSEEQNRQTSSSPSSTGMKPKRRLGDHGQPQSNGGRPIENFSQTPLESSAQFNQRAIRPAESGEVESSTNMNSQNQNKPNKDVEPSSSVHSFGKYTGLLADVQNSTPGQQTTDRPNGQSPQDSTGQPQQFTQTVEIIPGKFTETKIDVSSPDKASVVIQPLQQEQLSQVQDQPVPEKTKSDN